MTQSAETLLRSLQAPLPQVWPAGQSALLQQPPVGTQVPVLQGEKPGGQAMPQAPLTQVATPPDGAEQTLPQRPQLLGSDSVFPQDGSASIVHAPNVHGTPYGHCVLQPPQWFGSSRVLIQPPPQ